MSVAFILHSLLDLHSHPAQTIDDPETSIYRIDLLTAIEKAYKQGLLTCRQLRLLDMYLSGYSISYLSAREKNVSEELKAALEAIATLSVDYQDDVFIQKYKDQYKVSEAFLREKLETLGSDFSIIEEVENELECATV